MNKDTIPDYSAYRVDWGAWFGCFTRIYGWNAMRRCPKCNHPEGWHGDSSCLAERKAGGETYTDDDGFIRIRSGYKFCPCRLSQAEVALNNAR